MKLSHKILARTVMAGSANVDDAAETLRARFGERFVRAERIRKVSI